MENNMTVVEVLPVGCVMTLKDITDLLGKKVDHSKSMKKVLKLAEEPSFGGVAKMATPTYNPDGSINKTVQTLALTNKQCIAAAVRLDNKHLMRVIDKLEELTKPQKQLTYVEALRAQADAIEENQRLAIELKHSEVKLIETEEVVIEITEERDKLKELMHYLELMEDKGITWTMGEFAGEIVGRDPRITENIGRTRLMRILRELEYLQIQNPTLPYRPYLDKHFVMDKDDNGYPFCRITAFGLREILPEIVEYLR